MNEEGRERRAPDRTWHLHDNDLRRGETLFKIRGVYCRRDLGARTPSGVLDPGRAAAHHPARRMNLFVFRGVSPPDVTLAGLTR